jgi:hypothetical protein
MDPSPAVNAPGMELAAAAGGKFRVTLKNNAKGAVSFTIGPRHHPHRTLVRAVRGWNDQKEQAVTMDGHRLLFHLNPALGYSTTRWILAPSARNLPSTFS